MTQALATRFVAHPAIHARVFTENPLHAISLAEGGALDIALVLFPLLLCLSAAVIGGPFGTLLGILCLVFWIFAYVMFCTTGFRSYELSALLVVPIFIAAFQNAYLGLLARQMNPLSVQLSLVMHWIWAAACVLALGVSLARKHGGLLFSRTFWMILGLLAYSFILAVVFGVSPLAAFSALRNVTSPLLFFILGVLAFRHTRQEKFGFLVLAIGWGMIIFGLVEYLWGKEFWEIFNLRTLWDKKGLRNFAPWGLPYNFVSSELVFGQQIRRMASSFADPVNFGTVLFMVIAWAWFLRQWTLFGLGVICVVLAVSKGAFLGLLVFIAVWAVLTRARALAMPLVICCALMGGLFLLYSMFHSTNSVGKHAAGLVAAFRELPTHPLGRGMGNVGVLSGATSDVRESGLGVIVGQLGLIGLIGYGYFMFMIFDAVRRHSDLRTQVLGLSLLIGIALNIAFNEIALSPNSCAGYFITLGLIAASVQDAAQKRPLANRDGKFKPTGYVR